MIYSPKKNNNISIYCDEVIKPIEEKTIKIRNLVMSKGTAATEFEKELLNQYYDLLLEKYKVLETLLNYYISP